MVFTNEELQKIRDLGDSLELESAKMANITKQTRKWRKSRIAWIHPIKENMWMFKRIICEFREYPEAVDMQSLQYTIYNRGGHYNWHVDRSTNEKDPIAKRRVVAGVIQLSKPEEYNGGDLYLKVPSEEPPGEGNLSSVLVEQKIERYYGKLAIFPANMLHKVSKVTRGIRRSLVFWGLEGE